MYKHPAIKAVALKACFDGVLSDGIRYPEYFDDTRPTCYDDADEDALNHTPTFALVTLALLITAACRSLSSLLLPTDHSI